MHNIIKIQNKIAKLAVDAGLEVLKIYNSDFNVDFKSDNSPVTVADKLAEEIIAKGLVEIEPDFPIVAEEAVSQGIIPDVTKSDYFWLVDPVDGTNSFVHHNKQFTINIALIEKGQPVLGVVYAPVDDELFVGSIYSEPYSIIKGIKSPLAVKNYDINNIDIITNLTSSVDKEINGYKINNILRFNSSIKFCKMAQG